MNPAVVIVGDHNGNSVKCFAADNAEEAGYLLTSLKAAAGTCGVELFAEVHVIEDFSAEEVYDWFQELALIVAPVDTSMTFTGGTLFPPPNAYGK